MNNKFSLFRTIGQINKLTYFALALLWLPSLSHAFQFSFDKPVYTVNEGAGELQVRISASDVTFDAGAGSCTFVTSIRSEFVDGPENAEEGDDFQLPDDSITFRVDTGGPPVEQIVSIAIIDDEFAEGVGSGEKSEKFVLSVQVVAHDCTSGLGEFPIRSTTADVFIIDNDQPGELKFQPASYSISEGGVVTVSVSRIGGEKGAILVDVLAGDPDDSANQGLDYGAVSETQITWDNGDDQPKMIKIPIIADNIIEGSETFTVRLVKNKEILDVARVTITDSDAENATVVDRVEIISGDRQRFNPELSFKDLVIKVLFENGRVFSGVPIEWSVTPDGDGNLESNRTLTNESGESRNSFVVATVRRVVVRATVKLSEISGVGRRLQTRVEGDDPFVEFVINPVIADTRGLTRNQQNVAVALDLACPALEEKQVLTAGEQDLQLTCFGLQESDPDLVAESLSLLAHEEVTAQGTVLVETGNLQVMNVNARLNAIRAGVTGGINVSGLTVRVAGQSLPRVLVDTVLRGGSAGDHGGATLVTPWSGFVNGDLSFGKKGGTLNESGFDFNSVGLTAGADYRVSNTTVVGVSFGYGSNNTDLDGAAGNMDMSGLYLTAYGTYYQNDRIYIDGLVKLGLNDFETNRRVSKSSDPLQIAVGNTDGNEYSFSLSGGYDYNRGALTLTPYGRLSYVTASIDGYIESASNPGGVGSGSVLVIQGQDIDSLTSVIGGQFSYAISQPRAVYLPQLRFEWEHEFKDDSRETSAHFVHDPSSSEFSISSDLPDRNYFNLGMGFSVVAARGKSGFLYYETRIDQDNVDQHWLKAGLRLEF